MDLIIPQQYEHTDMNKPIDEVFSNILMQAAVKNNILEFAQGYLKRKGWFHSLNGSPCDASGPIPWYTYPAISFLTRIIRPEFKVFEYGCGNSTLWWAQMVNHVYSVEHNRGWYEEIRKKVPTNANLSYVGENSPLPPPTTHLSDFNTFKQLGLDLPISENHDHNIYHGLVNDQFQAYALEITKHAHQSFDVIIIDGMARAFSAFLADKHLKNSGILIFDNANRWQYNSIFDYLGSMGHRRVDFYGPGPVSKKEWSTAIFIKDLSILEGTSTVPVGSGDLGW